MEDLDDLCGPVAEIQGRGNARYRRLLVGFLLVRDGPQCWFCGRVFADADPCTVEHLIAVSAGGPRWLAWNTVLAHRTCNAAVSSLRLSAKLAYRTAAQRGREAVAEWNRAHLGGRTRAERRQNRRRSKEERRATRRPAAAVAPSPFTVPLGLFFPPRS